jgi:CHAT domain-containing protein
MVQVLEWLWDTAAGPVLDWLGHRETPRHPAGWRRIWWIPTGPLSALPLHAAGHHDDPLGSHNRRAVLDRVISSFTPTARALSHARRRLRTTASTGGATVVGIDDAKGVPPLTFAAAEARWVHQHLGLTTPPLVNDMATREQVIADLPSSRWAHFACHGIPSDDPADSRLALANGPLRVRDLTHLDLPHAYLAYLSACTSAFGGTELPNESIHIASSFQAAGFPHVIGTLWRVGDSAALSASQLIYSLLARGNSPAEAVHWTQHSLRSTDPFHPNLWAPHIHIGP